MCAGEFGSNIASGGASTGVFGSPTGAVIADPLSPLAPNAKQAPNVPPVNPLSPLGALGRGRGGWAAGSTMGGGRPAGIKAPVAPFKFHLGSAGSPPAVQAPPRRWGVAPGSAEQYKAEEEKMAKEKAAKEAGDGSKPWSFAPADWSSSSVDPKAAATGGKATPSSEPEPAPAGAEKAEQVAGKGKGKDKKKKGKKKGRGKEDGNAAAKT